MCIKLVIRKLLFTFLLLLTGASSFSQLPYTFERLNTESGLPTNTIKGLQFDEKHRFLWIATESGIVRYNGHNFQSFGDQEEKSILNNRVVYFSKAENGILFGKFVDATSFSINKNNVLIGKTTLKNNILNEFIENKYQLILNKSNIEVFSNNFNTYKINDEVFSINERYLIRFKKNRVDSLFLFDKDVQGFQMGNRLFIINDKNILSEIEISKTISSSKTLVTVKKVDHCEKYFKSEDVIKVFQDSPLDDTFIIISNKLYRIS